MAFRILPGSSISRSVSAVGTEQIDSIFNKFAAKSKKGSTAHETRKAMKRLRALLHLVRPAMGRDDFQRDEARLKQIARLMSGVRDIQAMLETIAKLESFVPALAQNPVTRALRDELEATCATAEKKMNGATIAQAKKLLRGARDAFTSLELKRDDFEPLAATIEADYRKARRAYRHAYEAAEDEAFHDWRKYVQRHWRQLLLIMPGWPKALRPHVILARELSETLGDDHDLYVLSNFIKDAPDTFGTEDETAAFLAACRQRQLELRKSAYTLGARLLAEKPGSLADRIRTYWETASAAKESEAFRDDDDNVIPLSR